MISSTNGGPACRAAHVFTTVSFLAVICSAAVIQTVAEFHRDGWPQALNVVCQAPTAANLRAFETDLEQASLLAGWLRPPTEYARFRLLSDGGQKALVRGNGWLFYRPGILSLTAADPTPPPAHADPLPAIVSFQRQLAERGIRLVVVPAPNKESIYPEMLTRRAGDRQVVVCQRHADAAGAAEELGCRGGRPVRSLSPG